MLGELQFGLRVGDQVRKSAKKSTRGRAQKIKIIPRMENKRKLLQTLMARRLVVVTHDNKLFDTSTLLTP